MLYIKALPIKEQCQISAIIPAMLLHSSSDSSVSVKIFGNAHSTYLLSARYTIMLFNHYYIYYYNIIYTIYLLLVIYNNI